MLIWSGFHGACGLSRTYLQFLFARIGVGTGEAGVRLPSTPFGGLFPAEHGRWPSLSSRSVHPGALACVLSPELTEGPVLPRRREAPPRHHRGTSRDAARAAADGRRRADVQAGQGRRSTSGTRRGRPLLGLRQRRQPHVHARDPAHRRHRARPLQDVYPGWYQGRAVHIHVKVHLGGSVVHTGQLFFPDGSPTRSTRRRRTWPRRPGHAQRERLDLT